MLYYFPNMREIGIEVIHASENRRSAHAFGRGAVAFRQSAPGRVLRRPLAPTYPPPPPPPPPPHLLETL